MEATLLNPEYIVSQSGKKLVNNKTSLEFSGYRHLPNSTINALETAGTVTAQTTRVGLAASIGTLTISSFFTTALSFFSKMIQMIEFTSLLALFNFEYDPLLVSFFTMLGKMTELDIIGFPLNDLVSNQKNSVASQWKGKLSENEIAPYYLQEFGYTGIPMFVSIQRNF